MTALDKQITEITRKKKLAQYTLNLTSDLAQQFYDKYSELLDGSSVTIKLG